MERMIVKHLSGSKANQVEEFALRYHDELTFGRDPSVTVKYDPDRDDLVGREHAKVSRDPNDKEGFIISDLGSRNGTFVNKQRIIGLAKLQPGDVVQFGPNGPEFQFDVEPRPSGAIKATRIAEIGKANTPNTRIAAVGTADVADSVTTKPQNATGKTSVGKATVERMISHSVAETKKQEGRKYATIGGIAAVAILILLGAVVGGAFWYNSRQQDNLQTQLKQKEELDRLKEEEREKLLREKEANAPKAAAEIADKYGKAVVHIRNDWRLINAQSKSPVYHQYLPNDRQALATLYKLLGVQVGSLGKGKILDSPYDKVPIYFPIPNTKRYEPALTNEKNDYSEPIGNAGGWGSGFIVTTDGYILTNRHVATPWRATFSFGDPRQFPPGLLMDPQTGKILEASVPPPTDWIPENTKTVPGLFQGSFEAENKIFVQLPKTDTPIAGQFIQASPRHDVAMIKISVPGDLSKVELFDSYDTLKKGDGLVVMGYPGTAPTVRKLILSNDMLNTEAKTELIPDPTVTVTAVGNIVRDKLEKLTDLQKSDHGDTIRYAGGLTFGGNSGGPVFDMQGRVIGIHFAGDSSGAGNFNGFAVPIRYGMELFPGNQQQ